MGKGDLETPFEVADFMRLIHEMLTSFSGFSRDLMHKQRVLKQSLSKVEVACYTLQVRSSEYPKDMLAELLGGESGQDCYQGCEDM